jgi:hypothetical protein
MVKVEFASSRERWLGVRNSSQNGSKLRRILMETTLDRSNSTLLSVYRPIGGAGGRKQGNDFYGTMVVKIFYPSTRSLTSGVASLSVPTRVWRLFRHTYLTSMAMKRTTLIKAC